MIMELVGSFRDYLTELRLDFFSLSCAVRHCLLDSHARPETERAALKGVIVTASSVKMNCDRHCFLVSEVQNRPNELSRDKAGNKVGVRGEIPPELASQQSAPIHVNGPKRSELIVQIIYLPS